MVALSNNVAAQGFGIRGGANFSTVTGGDIPDVGPITSYYAGVYYQMSLIKDFLYLQPELQYSSQGFTTDTGGIKTDYKIDYLTVPILAKIYVVKILSFEAGPQFGFNVSDTYDAVASGSSSDTVESFDPALAAGFNINLPFGLSLDFRYIYSFSEVIANTDEKNQVIQAGLGFKF